MRKWGVLVSIIYAVIVVGLLIPVAVLLAGPPDLRELAKGLAAAYQEWLVWVPVVIVLGGQALLLFLSVDTSQKRPEARSHIFLSCLAGTVLTALLTFAAIGCIGFAVQGEKFGEGAFASPFLFFGIAWAFRGIVFCFFLRNSSTVVNQIVSWRLWSPALALSPASLSCPFPLDQASCFCTGTGHLRPSFLYFAGKQKRRPHPREAPFLFHFKNSR